MPEFLELKPPLDALDAILQRLPPLFERQVEVVATENALGRVLAEPVLAREPLPSFARSTVDGYAVRATDTFGASESLPAYLEWLGEAPMGKTPLQALGRGQCVSIHTGGMLPEGADAIVMIEYTQMVQEAEVEILRAVAIGENVLKTGEDVAVGQLVIQAGASLRPAEIGGLMALGLTHVQVFARPSVGILSSGDELVSPDISIQPGQVRDINSYSLSALVEQIGGLPKRYGIAPDELQTLKESAQKALDENDCLVITAGSSASTRDLTSEVIGQLGEPGVLVHGVNVRPGKPTILAVCNGKPVIGLPGNPVSALVIASFFVKPVVQHLMGLKKKPFEARIPARLSINISSSSGREDWVAVRLEHQAHEILAVPIFGKSNLIFTLVRADGMIRVDADANGLSAGERVDVYLI
jgi:molybdopterin molybdotransferase